MTPTGRDPSHLDRLANLAQPVQPVRVSGRTSFARAPGAPGSQVLHANDLLPIAFTLPSLDIVVRNVTEVQERLQRPIRGEELSACLGFDDAARASEPAFLAALCRRSGSQLLLEVNN